MGRPLTRDEAAEALLTLDPEVAVASIRHEDGQPLTPAEAKRQIQVFLRIKAFERVIKRRRREAELAARKTVEVLRDFARRLADDDPQSEPYSESDDGASRAPPPTVVLADSVARHAPPLRALIPSTWGARAA